MSRPQTIGESFAVMFTTLRGLFATMTAAGMVIFFFTLPLNWAGCWKLIRWMTGTL